MISHYRKRKSIQLQIAVYSCENHQLAFTAYPPGYAPYSRSPLASVTPAGHLILPDPEMKEPLQAFRGTIFDCVVHDDDETKSPPSTRTVEKLCRLLGLGQGIADKDRLRMVTELDVPLTALFVAAKMQKRNSRRVQNIAAIRYVLSFVRVTTTLAARLARVAHVFGVWGRPYFSCQMPLYRFN